MLLRDAQLWRVAPTLAACALLAACVVLQPRARPLALAARSSAAARQQMLQAIEADADGWGGDEANEDAPPPEDIMAIQGAQAGSILGLDYMEASAAGAAATAASAAPELIPLLALRQRFDAPVPVRRDAPAAALLTHEEARALRHIKADLASEPHMAGRGASARSGDALGSHRRRQTATGVRAENRKAGRVPMKALAAKHTAQPVARAVTAVTAVAFSPVSGDAAFVLALGLESGDMTLVRGVRGEDATVKWSTALQFPPQLCHCAAVRRMVWRHKPGAGGLQLATCSADHSVRVFGVRGIASKE